MVSRYMINVLLSELSKRTALYSIESKARRGVHFFERIYKITYFYNN